MDPNKMIKELQEEKVQLEKVIQTVENLQRRFQGGPSSLGGGRRGRKSMGAKERQEVSARMKRYWEKRRRVGKP
jgi:hypothetical protein